jgi:hypothetical protein
VTHITLMEYTMRLTFTLWKPSRRPEARGSSTPLARCTGATRRMLGGRLVHYQFPVFKNW